MSYMRLQNSSESDHSEETLEKLQTSSENETTDRPSDRYHTLRIIATATVFLLTTLLITAAVVYIHSKQPTLPEPETCGTSITEASSHSCTFDPMSFAWLPARCLDSALTTDFLALRPWQWYLNSTTLEPANPLDVAAGLHDQVYVSQEYHLYHCTYMWRKMHRAVQAGRVWNGYLADLHHTAHCEMQILSSSGADLSEVRTTIYTKYANCPWTQQFAGRWGWYRMINGKKVHRDP